MYTSLEKSVRTCSVNTGEANRIQSDRFFNADNMVCIPWNGINSTGQEVCVDSWWTKTAGCNSAEDRVMVENDLRPSYSSYITLNAAGIDGDMYSDSANMSAHANAMGRQAFDQSRNSLSGNFGLQWGANDEFTGCTVSKSGQTAYERNMSQMAQAQRSRVAAGSGAESYNYRNRSGF